MIPINTYRCGFIQGRENQESDVSVFLCTVREMENCNMKKDLTKMKKERKIQISVLIVKDH